ncbi:precorrin-2 C(20)-methyltransferase [Geofilum sp. OHC36d9]|uniref:precorrin-2 C(20)-methyltransferase n=1 Tax=Geofilum sp. OHC36d9 TaxID=3458413 RepID=UPI0040335F7E
MNKGTLTGVGLGPGDPELITIKGYRALQAADIIFYPVTALNDGKQRSFSLQILHKLMIEKPCRPIMIPMSGKQRHQYYDEAYKTIKTEYEAGNNVVVVSEGDLLFYSTFGYLYKMALDEKIPCHLIPGIPAFIAAGSLGQLPLVEKEKGLQVIAKPENFEAIKKAMNQHATLVVMKISVLKEWYTFLKNEAPSFLYAEQVGTEHQFFTSSVEELEFRKIPYFSLLIIYPGISKHV